MDEILKKCAPAIDSFDTSYVLDKIRNHLGFPFILAPKGPMSRSDLFNIDIIRLLIGNWPGRGFENFCRGFLRWTEGDFTIILQ